MLRLQVNAEETFDEDRGVFVSHPGCVLNLEHSLLSISKWESIWHKPYLSSEKKTRQETISYIECMNVNSTFTDEMRSGITDEVIERVNEYISDSMTATWFSEKTGNTGGGISSEAITSELIYYWMIAYEIPFECQKWHLNRLLTLIRICKIKNDAQNGKNPKSSKEIAQQNAATMKARRARFKH